jgi:hypothetical protein
MAFDFTSRLASPVLRLDQEAVLVPEALRGRLGWDARHDRMAREIIAEFNLKLPRDSELIRQLAFVRVAQGKKENGVPF